MRINALIGLVLAMALLLTTTAWGEEPVTGGDAAARIAWIQEAMDDGSGVTKAWQYGWIGGYSAMAALEGANALDKDGEDEKDERFDSWVNVGASLAGVAGLLIDPLTLHKDARRLAAMPQESEEEIEAKLAAAELYLRQAAETEKRWRSLQSHLIAGAVNLTAGLIVTFDGGRTDDGFAIFAIGTLISEAQILTTPRHATAKWEAYKQGDINLSTLSPPSKADNLRFGVAPGYVQVSVLF